ncbi:hypothetical protein NFC81_12380 [Salinispirillum sp. LH 10-3-1]|uniref:DUF3037 domain-containing protein n=1 Tax=Salinispirillum sp. LH 10-3-1 TaxID=2952525 RepID=A0AB38YDU2_9GAMM
MPHSMVWLPTEEIINKIPCTCIDGRTPGLRYSVAGGSLGLLLHTLARIEQEKNTPFTDAQISQYVDLFITDVAPLYLHTDQHALDLIYARMGIAPDTRLRDMTEAQQRSFIAFATQTDFQGCGHVKLMMTHEDYHVPLRLIQATLREFFQLFFARHERVLFDVLAGRHSEERVLLLDEQGSMEIERQSALYLEAPQGENQFFCHRPLKRALMARFQKALNATELPSLSSTNWEGLAKEHDQAAEKTLQHLAPHLPIDHIEL